MVRFSVFVFLMTVTGATTAFAQQQASTVRSNVIADTRVASVVSRLEVALQAFDRLLANKSDIVADCEHEWTTRNREALIPVQYLKCWFGDAQRVVAAWDSKRVCGEYAKEIALWEEQPWLQASPGQLKLANERLFACESQGRKADVAVTAK